MDSNGSKILSPLNCFDLRCGRARIAAARRKAAVDISPREAPTRSGFHAKNTCYWAGLKTPCECDACALSYFDVSDFPGSSAFDQSASESDHALA
jgi:hypothetical protein